MNWSRLRQCHEDEWLLERLRHPVWQVALISASTLLLPARHRIAVAAGLMLSLVFPHRRIELLAFGSLVVLYQRLPAAVQSSGPLTTVAMGAILLLIAACYQAAIHYDDLPSFVRRNAILLLHAGLLGGVVSLWAIVRWHGGLGAGAGVAALAAPVPFLLWRLSYLILAGRRRAAQKSRFIDHLMYVLPLWGGTVTPYGKGYEYLTQHNADDTLALARSRVAGFKLLLLSVLWTKVGSLFALITSEGGLRLPARLGGGAIAIPSLENAIAASPGTFSFVERWMAVLVGLLVAVVTLAASGHAIIGVLRLFGFNVFRNTYKPLLATTILEFWNRYYYYFKELMVQFFFFPAFVRTATRRIEVRLALATLAAATFGNFYYHVVYDYRAFFGAGSEQALNALGGRFIYCAILGVAVAWSMLRERRNRGKRDAAARKPYWRTVRAIAGVWLFYGLLHIWNVGRHSLTVEERATFLLGLLGGA